ADGRTGLPLLVAYSLFPGYPGLFDVPVLTEQTEADLSIAPASWTGAAAAASWPGTGYFVTPALFAQLSGQHVTLALDFQSIAADPGEQLPGALGTIARIIGAADDAIDDVWASLVASPDASQLPSNRMRVVRPTHLAPLPGRAGDPPPTI